MSEQKVLSASEQKKEDWMNSKWRPMMGWMYMAVCMADFVLFPVLWSIVQAAHGGSVQTQWTPITLQGAGLFHMAMGAIIGVAAFGRTQEKLAGANNGGMSTPAPSFSAPSSPAPSFSAPPLAPSFSAPTPAPSFSAPAASAFTAAPLVSSTGKPMPAPAAEPEL